MKLVLQRVTSSSVWVDGLEISRILQGVTVFFGAEKGDSQENAAYLAKKLVNLRIFPDENGKMHWSCLDIEGEVLVVSQFTLASDCSQGRRPDFNLAAEPFNAEILYRFFIHELEQTGLKVQVGLFGVDMRVDIQNDGPVTFILEK